MPAKLGPPAVCGIFFISPGQSQSGLSAAQDSRDYCGTGVSVPLAVMLLNSPIPPWAGAFKPEMTKSCQLYRSTARVGAEMGEANEGGWGPPRREK